MRSIVIGFGLLLSTAVYAAEAIFAGGCFWCVEADFDKLKGVQATVSGYDGGKVDGPTYRLVASGKTKYVESVKVVYDHKALSYQKLVEYFLRHIDPTDGDGQFCDRGKQYRPVIFYQNELQKDIAYAALIEARRLLHKDKLAVDILPSTTFYPAEIEHQNYHSNHRVKYNYYRWRCGRDRRVNDLWNGKYF